MTIKELGARLKALRKEKKLSIRALAQKIGLSAHCLYNAESGTVKPHEFTLSCLALFYDVPLETLTIKKTCI